jgi:hypothetical protein
MMKVKDFFDGNLEIDTITKFKCPLCDRLTIHQER